MRRYKSAWRPVAATAELWMRNYSGGMRNYSGESLDIGEPLWSGVKADGSTSRVENMCLAT